MTKEEFKKQVIDVSSQIVQHLTKLKSLKSDYINLIKASEYNVEDIIKEDEEFEYRLENRERSIDKLIEELEF